MKTTLTAVIIIALMVLVTVPNQMFAQAPDTVTVYANPPGASNGELINDFINGDTTSTGQRNNPNRVYVLQQTGSVDSTYFLAAPIEAKYHLTIIGKKNPITGKIPLIECYTNPDNSTAPEFFIGDTLSSFTFKDLYFLSTRTDGNQGPNVILVTHSGGVSVNTDHCIYENFGGNMFTNNGDHFKFIATNNEFRNITSVFWQGGSVLWSNGGAIVDTLIYQNNTFFCVTRAAYGSPKYIGYLKFDHNTMFLGIGGTFLAQQLTNATFTNNIFYGLMAHGADSSYIKSGGANAAHQGFGVIMVDTLSSLLNPPYSQTEAGRNIVVKNNAYCWPQAMYTYWQTVTDTGAAHHPGLITPPIWMNAQTQLMFNDKTKWPGLSEANNDSVDPGFASTLVNPAVDSCLKFANLIWTAQAVGAFRWSQMAADPFNLAYPVSENLRYSNTTLYTAGTDGKPLGDLNWFPELMGVEQISSNVPASYSLSQNYPNPFNPTTVINYTVPKSSFVSLKVYNILGQEVATLYQGFQKSGTYKANFDASKLSSGVYLYRLQSNGFNETKKMILMK